MASENDIIVRIIGKGELDPVNKQLEEGTKQLKEMEDAMTSLLKAEDYRERELKNQIKNEKELDAALKALRESYKGQIKQEQDSIEKKKKSIETLQLESQALNLLKGSTKSATAQIREIRNAMMEMEEAGLTNSGTYEQLGIKAAELTDAMGDLQQRINVLASDTKNLDTAMSVGSGIAGAFNTATSTAELFGGELEGLQTAFYKVQAVLSILNGVQSVANVLNKDSAAMVVLNNALEKVRAKNKMKVVEAETAETASTVANTAATTAETAAVGAAETAQWSLNAAMAANPIGVIVAIVLTAIAAFAALGIGVYKLVHSFTAAGKAEKAYADASKELEKIQAKQAITASKRAYDREQQVKKISEAEETALLEAKKRNASEVEMAQIRANFAKQAASDTTKYTNQEIKLNNDQVEQLQKMRDAKAIQLREAREGSKKYKKLQEELAEAEQNYYDAVKKGKDLEQERSDARKKQADDELELLRQQEQMREQTNQLRIDMMKEGATKEIAQINANYKEQLKAVQGNSKEETELRKALLAKQAKEIADVRKKYALQAQQTSIQEQKNLLTAMSQSGGTEADYAQQIALTKQVTEAEAQLRIDSLDKQVMGEKAYKAEVDAIRMQLQADLKRIDDDEIARKNEQAKRLTEIDIEMAESATRALTGAEGVEGQLLVWENYYSSRRSQIDDNEQMEIDAVNRSTATVEEKERMITQIQLKASKEREDLTREEGEKEITIREDSIRTLQRALANAEDDLNAPGGSHLAKLQARYDAEIALYDEQQSILDQKYQQNLISYQDYQDQMLEITRQRNAAEVQLEQDKLGAIAEGLQQGIGYMQQISSMAFDVLNSQVQAEMDALEETYTTDAKEAAKNANKKYISEKEYEKRKAELEMRAARYKKTQTMIDIGLATALAIVSALATAPPYSFIAAGIAGAMGAAQLAIAAAKPLAQYEKGRKGGKGEYAIVGEKGAELMYVPEGASIVPHNKIDRPDTWGQYGVPMLAIPDRPDIDTTGMAIRTESGWKIDYDRLGAAVAKNIPPQNAVTVNVDRSGILVSNGRDTRQYLNTKYQAAWN